MMQWTWHNEQWVWEPRQEHEQWDEDMSNRRRAWATGWGHERWDESMRWEQRWDEDISNMTMADIVKEYYNNPGPWTACVSVSTPTPATFLIIQTQNQCTISVLKSSCNQMEKLATGPDCNWFGLDHSCQLQRNPPLPVAGCRVSLCHTKLVATGCHCKVVYCWKSYLFTNIHWHLHLLSLFVCWVSLHKHGQFFCLFEDTFHLSVLHQTLR